MQYIQSTNVFLYTYTSHTNHRADVARAATPRASARRRARCDRRSPGIFLSTAAPSAAAVDVVTTHRARFIDGAEAWVE